MSFVGHVRVEMVLFRCVPNVENQTSSQLSNVQNPVDIPLYWLVNRDPYNGLL